MKKTVLLLTQIIVLLSTISSITFAQSWTQLGSDIDGEAASDLSGYSVSLSSDGSRVAIGAKWNDGNGNLSGHVRVYNYSAGTWTQLGSDIDGEAKADYSGISVSLSSDGSRVAIGAYMNDGNGITSGHVRVYNYSAGTWSQLGSDIDGEAAADFSGYSVSLSSDGSRVAIGAPNNNGNGSGHVRVYNYSGGTWTQLGLDIDGEAASDQSGQSVSLSSDGSRVAIGALYNDGVNGNSSGHVRVYNYSAGTWSQLGSDIDGEAAADFSGYSVSLSSDGSRVAIGAPQNDGNGILSGHVRVYNYSAGVWTQLGSDIDGEAASDTSGYSVCLSSDGNRVAIGAPLNGGNGILSGHVRVYNYSAGVWTKLGNDIDGEAAADNSGWSVSLSSDGSRVAIGAPLNGGNGILSGHVRVFSTAPEINLKQSATNIADGGSYDYGSKVSGSNTDVVFTIENTGIENLTLTTPLTLGGADASQFSIQAQPTSPIAGSGSTTFTVRFSPTSVGAKIATIAIANNDSDENPYNLTLNGTGTEYPYIIISGYVKYSNGDAVEGVELVFSNGGATVTTDANGYYNVFITKGWSGTSTPSKTGLKFTPISYTYSGVSTNQTDQDFVAQPKYVYAFISGYVKDSDGNPIAGVLIEFSNSGQSVLTNALGYYEMYITEGWDGTSTPSMTGYSFEPSQYTYIDVTGYYYNQDFVETVISLGVEDINSLPTSFTVLPAYPNPFNPSTTITYGLDNDSDVSIQIYDITGQLISTLQDNYQTQGWHSAIWNGTNQHGEQVPAGLYLSQVTSNNNSKTIKLMLLK